jgi:hypothetical protein
LGTTTHGSSIGCDGTTQPNTGTTNPEPGAKGLPHQTSSPGAEGRHYLRSGLGLWLGLRLGARLGKREHTALTGPTTPEARGLGLHEAALQSQRASEVHPARPGPRSTTTCVDQGNALPSNQRGSGTSRSALSTSNLAALLPASSAVVGGSGASPWDGGPTGNSSAWPLVDGRAALQMG